MKIGRASIVAFLLVALAVAIAAQEHETGFTPAATERSVAPAAQGAGVFPSRPPGNPTAISRGKMSYGINCAYCHGDDARGGNGGTNILRSDYIMKDRDGDLLRQFLLNTGENGHVGVREGVLKFNFSADQASDIASFIGDISAFIHDFKLSSRDPGRMRPPTIVVGDSKAGQVYFQSKCASCHSVTGDLKGIATRIDDPRSLQQSWLMPVVAGSRGGGTVVGSAASGVPPITVTVTLADGQKVEGNLGRVDDFIVTLTLADGAARSFRRDGNRPHVEIHDPLQPHKDLLRVYTDKDIHDVTAYLVTVK